MHSKNRKYGFLWGAVAPLAPPHPSVYGPVLLYFTWLNLDAAWIKKIVGIRTIKSF
jgi:hypothetical protein